MTLSELHLLSQKINLTWIDEHHKSAITNIIARLVEKSYAPSQRDPFSDRYYGIGRCEKIYPEIYREFDVSQPIWSFFGHSQGGKGKLIEKVFTYCGELNDKIDISRYNVNLKDLFNIIRVKEINKEHKFDVGFRRPDEHLIILIELKTRVDSGGSAGRTELLTKISGCICRDIPQIYLEAKSIGIKRVSFIMGILYNVKGKPATLEDDKNGSGFASSVKTDIIKLKRDMVTAQFIIDEKMCTDMSVEGSYNDLIIDMRCLYGEDLIKILLKDSKIVTSLQDFENLINEYDDVILALKTSLNERRRMICNNGMNNLQIFVDYFTSLSDDKISHLKSLFNVSLEEFTHEVLKNVNAVGELLERQESAIVAFISYEEIKKEIEKERKVPIREALKYVKIEQIENKSNMLAAEREGKFERWNELKDNSVKLDAKVKELRKQLDPVKAEFDRLAEIEKERKKSEKLLKIKL
jgi:hypothetical protein